MVKDPKPEPDYETILKAISEKDSDALLKEAAKKAPKITHHLSNSTAKVFVYRADSEGNPTAEAQATCCFWRIESSIYLITNWHVVTGWNPIADKPILDNGFTPTHLRSEIVGLRKLGGLLILRDRKELSVDLFDEHSEPVWFEHPKHGKRVDVVAIHFCDVSEGVELLTIPVNTYKGFMDFEVSAGNDAFVIGYPLGISGGEMPIWKRASIASEPDIDIDGLPKFLIDTATRKGMSGSPVIVSKHGLINPRGADKLGLQSVIGTAETFAGIYSGRVDDDPLGAQLGIVWKASTIQEILSKKVRGKKPR